MGLLDRIQSCKIVPKRIGFHRMILRSKILEDRECRHRAQGAPQGRRTVGGGGLQCQSGGAGGRPEGREYRGGYGNRGTGRYVNALPPAPALMVPGQEDVEHYPGGEGGAVPDGLHSGDGSPSLWKCLCPGSQAYLILLNSSGLPTQCSPEGASQVPWGAQAPPPPPTDCPKERTGGFTEVRPKAAG